MCGFLRSFVWHLGQKNVTLILSSPKVVIVIFVPHSQHFFFWYTFICSLRFVPVLRHWKQKSWHIWIKTTYKEVPIIILLHLSTLSNVVMVHKFMENPFRRLKKLKLRFVNNTTWLDPEVLNMFDSSKTPPVNISTNENLHEPVIEIKFFPFSYLVEQQGKVSSHF